MLLQIAVILLIVGVLMDWTSLAVAGLVGMVGIVCL
jgi:hypothetical protein